MVAVSRKVNRKRMMQMLLTGEPIKANYAKEIGLINNHFAKAKLNNEVFKVAKKIASKAKIDGFRPGKVPSAHIEKLYGQSVIVEVIEEKILSDPLAPGLLLAPLAPLPPAPPAPTVILYV